MSGPRSRSKVAPELELEAELQEGQEARGQEAGSLPTLPGVSSIF